MLVVRNLKCLHDESPRECREYLNIIKVIFKNPTVKVTLNREKLEEDPLKSRTRQGYLFPITIFKFVLEVQGIEIRKEKGI